MSFKGTQFYFLYDECINQFGDEQGNKIFELADRKLVEMKKEADYRNSKAIKKHLDNNLLPAIAIYLAFKESNFDEQEAYKNTLEMAQIGARRAQRKNQPLGKLPFSYHLFKMLCKFVMNKDYPIEGWDITWQQYDKREIHFDMTRCIYKETTDQYNCPKLCPVFCANDVTTFAGYKPNIIFEREGTIGEGKERCDFHFKNAKML